MMAAGTILPAEAVAQMYRISVKSLPLRIYSLALKYLRTVTSAYPVIELVTEASKQFALQKTVLKGALPALGEWAANQISEAERLHLFL